MNKKIVVRGRLICFNESSSIVNGKSENIESTATVELDITEDDIREAIEKGNKMAFKDIPEQGDQSYEKVMKSEAKEVVTLLTGEKEEAVNPTKQHSHKCPKLYGEECKCDGYHTFDELYEHRIRLFIELCKALRGKNIWCSIKHSDDTCYDDWFILGVEKEEGKQITYHLPAKFWNEVCEFAEVLPKAPKFDGHSSDNVIERLSKLQAKPKEEKRSCEKERTNFDIFMDISELDDKAKKFLEKTCRECRYRKHFEEPKQPPKEIDWAELECEIKRDNHRNCSNGLMRLVDIVRSLYEKVEGEK